MLCRLPGSHYRLFEETHGILLNVLVLHCLLQMPTKTETPKERLKRLMAAQINKQVAKDSVKTAQKVAHEEKERTARVQIERMQYDGGRRSPSPPRYRSVLSCLVGIGISAKHGLLG